MIDNRDAIILGFVFFVCFITIHMKPYDVNNVHKIFKQSARWHEQSTQDAHPLVALRDATFACAYLNAARELANDTQLEQQSGTDIQKYRKALEDHQLQCLRRVSKLHKKLNLSNSQSSLCQWL